MGWYADTDWDLRFHNIEAKAEALAALKTAKKVPDDLGIDFLGNELVEMTGEDASNESDDPLTVNGWTNGKCHLDQEVFEAIAPFVTGTVHIVVKEGTDEHGLYRFDGKTVTGHDGVVVFPTDNTEQLAEQVWSLTTLTPDSVAMVTTLHPSEEACWESLVENYDPEGEHSLERPVEIVEALSQSGYRIEIDVHDLSTILGTNTGLDQ